MTTPRDGRSAEARAVEPSVPTRDAGWKLVGSWLVVGIPAAWGVTQVIVKSLALFR
ncbi:MAG: hypothetical protein ABI910_17065 [Gemmatimonadota bacterium]